MSDCIHDENNPAAVKFGGRTFFCECAIESARKEIARLTEENFQLSLMKHMNADIEAVIAENSRLRDAHKRVTEVSQFGREGGLIVESEHYEAAWLDCIEIAKEALASPPKEEKPI